MPKSAKERKIATVAVASPYTPKRVGCKIRATIIVKITAPILFIMLVRIV